jgi:hypothetical protein
VSVGIQVNFVGGASWGMTLSDDRLPSECPQCHRQMHPVGLVGWGKNHINDPQELQLILRCPRTSCLSAFIAYYVPADVGPAQLAAQDESRWKLLRVAPTASKQKEFDDRIKEFSPGFVKIYNQSLAAEIAGLDEVCGIGYRKALEFLIKDYVCKKRPTETESIKKTPLATCINNYVDHGGVKSCAERATWLGNDETHYVRKWESMDVEDLKALIELTISWMMTEMLTADYMATFARRQAPS